VEASQDALGVKRRLFVCQAPRLPAIAGMVRTPGLRVLPNCLSGSSMTVRVRLVLLPAQCSMLMYAVPCGLLTFPAAAATFQTGRGIWRVSMT
jgi:hypothetical protein